MKKMLIVGNVSNAVIKDLKNMGYEIIRYNYDPKEILGKEFNLVWIREHITSKNRKKNNNETIRNAKHRSIP
jgi:hypothetical protein